MSDRQPAARRAKGRPKDADQRVGRDDILRAATELLRTTPLEKLSSAAVARQVGVSPQLINYYFRSRSELLVAIAIGLIREEGELSGFVEMRSDMPPEAALRTRLRVLVQRQTMYPQLSRLITDHVLKGESPDAQAALAELVATAQAAYSALIERGVAAGVFKPVRPEFLYLSTIGMCDFFAVSRKIIGMTSGRSETEEAQTDAYIEFAVGLIIDGLRPR